MFSQSDYVLRALPQRGHPKLKLAEPMEEILAEASRGHGGVEILIGGGDDTDVDLDFSMTAQAVKRISVQHAQELHLSLRLQFADFIQKKCSLVREFEQAGLGRIGASERALFVAEQLTLD